MAAGLLVGFNPGDPPVAIAGGRYSSALSRCWRVTCRAPRDEGDPMVTYASRERSFG